MGGDLLKDNVGVTNMGNLEMKTKCFVVFFNWLLQIICCPYLGGNQFLLKCPSLFISEGENTRRAGLARVKSRANIPAFSEKEFG